MPTLNFPIFLDDIAAKSPWPYLLAQAHFPSFCAQLGVQITAERSCNCQLNKHFREPNWQYIAGRKNRGDSHTDITFVPGTFMADLIGCENFCDLGAQERRIFDVLVVPEELSWANEDLVTKLLRLANEGFFRANKSLR